MSICNFGALNGLILKEVEDYIVSYSRKHGVWIRQFDEYFWITRISTAPRERMLILLSIVRGNGWNMNRQGQCEKISRDIEKGLILDEHLIEFWQTVDNLPNIQLRDLSIGDPAVLMQMDSSFNKIRKTLSNWHGSAGTICFLTKVILMFNWGQSPAFDKRVRSVLRLCNEIKIRELVRSFGEIGSWITKFERKIGINLDEFVTNTVRKVYGRSINPIPLGRSFDMLLFSLA